MPRNIDPASIRIGPGVSGSETESLSLVVGASPFIGHLGPDQSHPFDPGQAALAALKAHIQDIHNAHPAVAISVEDATPKQFEASNVEGALDELFSATLPPPPSIGLFAQYTTFTGISDWGAGKLADCSIRLRDDNVAPVGGSANTNLASEVYPYFLVEPTPTADPVFTIPGSDPSTDIYWNCPVVEGGIGKTTAAGCTSGSDVVMTRAFLGGATAPWYPVVVSGTIFPADRGVLAILHIPTQGDLASFLAQPLLKRCIAALLLGQGLEGDACIDSSDPTGGACDGGPGGIFDVGHNRFVSGNPYNPFAFPGRASGQYDLDELYLGVSSIDGITALHSPWDVPKQKTWQGRFGAYGQVRLGSDPDLGSVVDWGIPVLGAKHNAYIEGAHVLDTVPVGLPFAGEKCIGDSLVFDTNFFSYRLPCLGDYSAATGLKYTPKGVSPFSPYRTFETARYFRPGFPDVDYQVPITGSPYHWETPVSSTWVMTQAGDYTNFDEDYWTWQIARYRHTFFVSGDAALADSPRPDQAFLGTYWLTHFKSEKDFEAFMLSATVPVEVYGAEVIKGGMSFTGTMVNESTAPTEWAPFGPAPAYGYAASTYHATRRELALGGSPADHVVTPAMFTTSEFSINISQEFILPVSGIGYLVPLFSDGSSAVTLETITVKVDPGAGAPWAGSYRTDDLGLTGNPPVAPAVLSTPCPAMVSIAPFSFGLASGVIPTYTAPTALLSDPGKARQGRIEMGFTKCGTHAGNPFAMDNAPDAADALDIVLALADPNITLEGDLDTPAFSADAALRAFIRRPQGHATWETSALPLWDPSVPADVQGHGQRIEWNDPRKILFHSTKFVDGVTGKFGNFLDGGGAPQSFLMSQDKDTEERFLDEVYRYRTTWEGLTAASEKAHLVGPGIAGWGGGPIGVPVRTAPIGTDWSNAAWVVQLDNTQSLVDGALTYILSELQVSGLPERNPPIKDWVKYPFPSAGLLKYPNIDYSGDYFPAVPEGWTQPDYSGATGTRGYVRAFDVAFSHAGALAAVDAAGQPFVTLRVDGLQLEDFQYAPGPITRPTIYVKVPGLTTWMHLGRSDGAGPSKQDPVLDGAGCQVIGPYTFNGVNTDTGLVYCQVQVNVGPAVNLALSGVGTEVPLLVKVEMPELITGQWDLTRTYSAGAFGDPSGPGLESTTIRGLVGLKVVHPTLVETAP